MTPDDLAAAFERGHKACPCAKTYKCSGEDDHVCSGPYVECRCENAKSQVPCSWPGHAALDEIASGLHVPEGCDCEVRLPMGGRPQQEILGTECAALRERCLGVGR